MTATEEEVRSYPFGRTDHLQVDPELVGICGEHPVLRVRLPFGGEGWLVTRHADVRTVLADPRFSRAAAAGDHVPRTVAIPPPATSILGMDPPDHTRLRRRVANAFTVRRVETLRPRTEEIVNGLLDRMIASGPPADLAGALSWTLPITVICEMLGVPVTDRDRFTDWVDDLLMLSDPERSARSREELGTYLSDLIARRRVHPTDDLLGELVNGDPQDPLGDQELISLGVSLLSAGQEATSNQIGNFVYTLMTQRHLWEQLVADRTLIPNAVEELSRYIPISATAGFTRIALEDVVLGGRLIPAGDAVVCELGLANRDSGVFDRPEEIDFHRGHIPHVSFGHGIHHCLGAQLARLELRVVLETLTERLPDLRLDVPADQLTWRTERLIRGVAALPVRW